MFGQHDENAVTSNGTIGAPALPNNQPAQAAPLGAPINAQAMAAPTYQNEFSGAALDAPTTQMSGAPMPPPAMAAVQAGNDPGTADDLIGMKQEALKHLQPLVGNLQQSPEEEFRTLMMMIQATDDKTMLKKALDAAKNIPDDKARAQAMLDVINEINYFTQSQ